jgi:hypothetical protein
MNMSDNLLEAINDLITPSLLGQASSALGEPEAAVSKGIGAVIPLLLGGVASRADDRDFMSSLFGLVTRTMIQASWTTWAACSAPAPRRCP